MSCWSWHFTVKGVRREAGGEGMCGAAAVPAEADTVLPSHGGLCFSAGPPPQDPNRQLRAEWQHEGGVDKWICCHLLGLQEVCRERFVECWVHGSLK